MTGSRSRLAILGALALTVSLAPAPAIAEDDHELAPIHPAPSAETGELTHESSGLWFVELDSSPSVDGTSRSRLRREKANFRSAARARGLRYQERMSFETLWNGVSVRLDSSQLDTLRRIPEVKAIYPVQRVSIPETTEISPQLSTALAMTGADAARAELGLSGEGVRVAVMDTGIDYNHPDLGGPETFPTQRVVAGRDFVGDDYNAGHPDHLVPQPDADPMDCNGHGTHVAGIVGADGAVTGAAPGVAFGAYKVFGCEGSTTADVMLQAMEQALRDGMDVLNMSIGSAFTWPQYPTATASDRLVRLGMVVVASIGNSGASGVYSAGSPGVGADVIGVASFDNSHINALTFDVDPSGQQVPYLPLATAQEPPTAGGSPEVVYVGRACPSLGDTLQDDPAGKVALVVRGDCTFNEKYTAAVEAGASGVVIYNNVDGLFAGGGVVDQGVFGIGISDTHGHHLRELLDAGETVTVTWTENRVNTPNPTGGLISSFSSYGPAPDLSLKPDIGAPGGLIRSTYPLALGGYATISGTSMSSPHVAGGVALLLEADPKLRAGEVRAILQNAADPARWWGNPDLGFLDNVHRQGAGMLDIPGAVQATTAVSPSKLSLGESGRRPHSRTLTIRNDGNDTETYTLSHEPALGTHGSTFVPGFNAAFADVAFEAESLRLRPGKTARVNVTVTPPAGDQPNLQYGGYLEVTGDDGTTTRVPYGGFAGDYQSIDAVTPVLDPEGGVLADVPWLTKITSCELLIGLECVAGGNFENQPGGATFTLDTDGPLPDIPYFLVHLDHQVQRLELTVLDADTGDPVHKVFNQAVELSHVARNSTSTSFFAYAWDGNVTLSRGNAAVSRPVRDGDYRVELRALKALGDAGNPEHWETWTSPVITIDRP